MVGYRTLLVNFVGIVLPAVLSWMAGVDWSSIVSPSTAAIIVSLVNIGMRFVTTTPVGKSA